MNTEQKYPFDKLKTEIDGLNLYLASSAVYYLANFTRDAFIAALLAQDPKMFKDQITFNNKLQGKKTDPISGEEPGKMHHEHPPVDLKGLSTYYNGCDTTALYLIGVESYLRLTHSTLSADEKEHVEAAVTYILSHLYDYAFVEDDGTLRKAGTELQLWTVAARKYFDSKA